MKLEDLSKYDILLVKFDGKIVTLKGMIRLPVQSGNEVVEVDFIVIDGYLSYIAILARQWLHIMRAVSSTLHVMMRFGFKFVLKLKMLMKRGVY